MRRVLYRSAGAFLADWDVHLSRGSVFVNTRRLVSIGTRVRVVVCLARTAFRVELVGQVAQACLPGNGHNACPGILVELSPMEPEVARALYALAMRLKADARSFGGRAIVAQP